MLNFILGLVLLGFLCTVGLIAFCVFVHVVCLFVALVFGACQWVWQRL